MSQCLNPAGSVSFSCIMEIVGRVREGKIDITTTKMVVSQLYNVLSSLDKMPDPEVGTQALDTEVILRELEDIASEPSSQSILIWIQLAKLLFQLLQKLRN